MARDFCEHQYSHHGWVLPPGNAQVSVSIGGPSGRCWGLSEHGRYTWRWGRCVYICAEDQLNNDWKSKEFVPVSINASLWSIVFSVTPQQLHHHLCCRFTVKEDSVETLSRGYSIIVILLYQHMHNKSLNICPKTVGYPFLQSTSASYTSLRSVCFFSVFRFQSIIHLRT